MTLSIFSWSTSSQTAAPSVDISARQAAPIDRGASRLGGKAADGRLFNIYRHPIRAHLGGAPGDAPNCGAPCYLAGTLIAVPGGEVPVEGIVAGDLVLTLSGAARPVRWVGWRAYAGRFVRANPAIHPVRVRAGALGEGLPRRALLVSPDHALYFDDVLIPAAELVNDRTITRERGLADIRYHHIELDSHDILLAEGVPAESYADDDSRRMFHNGADIDPAPEPAAFCAPRLTHGEAVEAVRRRIASIARATELAA